MYLDEDKAVALYTTRVYIATKRDNVPGQDYYIAKSRITTR